MRLDQRTVILLVVLLVVIVAGLVITNPANAPAETPTPVEGSGPVFGEIDQTTITGIAVTNNDTGETTVLTKDEGGAWAITEATNSTDRATDQAAVTTALNTLATLASSESFTTENLADFGLDAPTHTIVLTAVDGTTHTLLVGGKAPANPRYYSLLDDDATTVYVVNSTGVDSVTGLIAAPPYVPAPTATATFTPSPNPYSEVEQTATAAIEQEATMQSLFATMTATAGGESTAEATAEAASADVTEEATEAVAEATEEVTEAAAPDVTEEATVEAVEVTEEATAEAVEATEEATEEATPTPSPTRRPSRTPTPTETPTPTNTAEPLPTAITADSEARYVDIPQSLSEEGFPQLGEPDAPVQVTLYSSFGCPVCREFHVEVFFNLLERVRAGEVLVTIVPLTTGNITRAEQAAHAAICAAQQDAFWPLADALFERQGRLRNQAFTSASLEDAASDAGVDVEAWQACLESDLPGEVVTAAQENSEAQAVEDVPAVLVNGEAVDADLEAINAAIDAAPEATAAP